MMIKPGAYRLRLPGPPRLPQPLDKRRVGVVWHRASARIRLVRALLAEARLPSISG